MLYKTFFFQKKETKTKPAKMCSYFLQFIIHFSPRSYRTVASYPSKKVHVLAASIEEGYRRKDKFLLEISKCNNLGHVRLLKNTCIKRLLIIGVLNSYSGTSLLKIPY